MVAKTDKATFEHSQELKRFYLEHFEIWSKKHRAGVNELAERCGVSAQYLGHIGRYGRIPSKPILVLLALNFELADPQQMFRAANLKDPWPYELGWGLRPRSAAESSLLSVHLDMPGFTNTIREIVRAEIRPKALEELLGQRPLRVGLNRDQSFLFQGKKLNPAEGFFPELIQLLALALHVSPELINVSYTRYSEALRLGEIDLYGPVYYTAPRIGQALYTKPFCEVRLGGLFRLKKCAGLANLPAPRKVADLRKNAYRIAVHKDSMSQHFAVNDLGLAAEQIIPCETPEESIERLLMTNVPRPAHLLLTDAPHAFEIQSQNRRDLQLLFSEESLDAPPYENTIAVRSDWASALGTLNSILELLGRNGSVQRLYQRLIDPVSTPGISVA